MATVLVAKQWGRLYIYEVDADPSAGAGTQAPLGTLAMTQTGQLWQKTGALDTNWTNQGVVGPSSAWQLTGNALTGAEFLGSTNAFDVPFRANNVEVARLIQTGGWQHGVVGAGATLGAIGAGSMAFGDLGAGATLRALATGGVAHGGIGGAGIIQSGGAGGYAGGYVDGGGTILSTSTASYAFGNATGAFVISATAEGARSSGYAVSGSILCSGQASRAHGDNLNVTGRLAQAFGIGHVLTADNALVCGTFALVTGVAGAPAATDTAFAVGNGVIGVPANAWEVSRDGRTTQTAAERHGIEMVSGVVAVSARTHNALIVDNSAAPAVLNFPPGEDGLEIEFNGTSDASGANSITLNANGADVFQGGAASVVFNGANNNKARARFLGGTWWTMDFMLN